MTSEQIHVETAAQAFERYQDFLREGRLVQSQWHAEVDGRQLACGLGVLGDDVNGPRDCPATIMPRWLAQMVPWLFDAQAPEDAFAWGLDFYAELKRLDGQVPFLVIHDWQANVVAPIGLQWAEKRSKDKALIEAVRDLHLRALKDDLAPRTAWFEALQPAFRQVYANANADAYAYANANANANANADAYAYADADAYADAYAYAYANADAYAYADADAYADAYAYRQKIKALASGLVECLRRVPAKDAS